MKDENFYKARSAESMAYNFHLQKRQEKRTWEKEDSEQNFAHRVNF